MKIVEEQKIGRVLHADPGKILTNGVSFGVTIWLAENDDPENWTEVEEFVPSLEADDISIRLQQLETKTNFIENKTNLLETKTLALEKKTADTKTK